MTPGGTRQSRIRRPTAPTASARTRPCSSTSWSCAARSRSACSNCRRASGRLPPAFTATVRMTGRFSRRPISNACSNRWVRAVYTVLYGLEPEKAFHRLEIAVGMQQHMAALDAERADDQVDRLADRDPLAAKKSIVRGGDHCQSGVAQRNSLESAERAL